MNCPPAFGRPSRMKTVKALGRSWPFGQTATLGNGPMAAHFLYNQPEDREGPTPRNPADAARARRRGDRVNRLQPIHLFCCSA